MFRQLINFWDNTSFYLDRKVFYAGYGIAALFVLSFFVPALQTVAVFLLLALAIVMAVDSLLLYQKRGVSAERVLPPRLSNGDENKISIHLENGYSFPLNCTIIEELPVQFQERNWQKEVKLPPQQEHTLTYLLKPQERGEYKFGQVNVYANGPLGFVRRRYILGEEQITKVYPSYVQMRRFQLLAVANRLNEVGSKRIRKLGQSMEFEQIKEYVRGDDYRTINWKATARKGDLMVNNFTDERSQEIYCLVNKGRVMKMPFEGMTLLDYAINASLVLSSVALQKQDKAGLITFGQNVDAFLQADKKPTQINNILEALYKQETAFLEPDLEKLFSAVRNRITQRSLLVLFTNFESFDSLERVLPSLKRLAHYHLLMVVFFDNTEIKSLIESKATRTEDIYIKTIAEKYRYEKQLIVKELQKNGIVAVLSTPQNLTINALNKYLELKTKQSI
ncbi:MAG: DUF58 domain-containing protein [Chitinophagaceae bacterium]|nr:MAG: DUF58 domain-containing protein [Chitinophagaceae bacterium]